MTENNKNTSAVRTITIPLERRFVGGIAAIIFIMVASMAAHVALSGPTSVLERALQDGLHAPGFAGVTVALLFVCRSVMKTRVAIGSTVFLASMLAFLSEGLQVFVTRDADFGDLFQDFLGIAFGVLVGTIILSILGATRIRRRYRRFAYTVATLSGILTIGPLAHGFYAIRAQESSMPILANFESSWEKKLYAGSLRNDLKLLPSPGTEFDTGRRSALMDLTVHEKKGLELFPYPDWSNYNYLSFTVASATGESFEAALRIHDVGHINEYWDRFAIRFNVPVEPTTVRISLEEVRTSPRNREMDMSRIDAVIFFATNPEGNEKAWIDNIRLEPSMPSP